MSEMTSGAFAAATRLSAKALRLYAESGLLVPEFLPGYLCVAAGTKSTRLYWK